MQKIEGIKSQKVYDYFEKLCSIPHGSYHVEEISDFLVEFAQNEGLRYIQDAEKNVVIYKDATSGYENEPIIVIQGHMDMVAVHDNPLVDMNETPLQLKWLDSFLYAQDSSLGADDGIAVAYAMAILASKESVHPALEVVITTNEEVGMEGAIGLDTTNLKGRRVLNIDSEEEGVFTVGCAGGVRVEASISLKNEAMDGEVYLVEINGLYGGHSGTMIHLKRANACCLIGHFLERVMDEIPVHIVDLLGGTKCNAIPAQSLTKVMVDKADEKRFITCCERVKQEILSQYCMNDPQATISLVKQEKNGYACCMADTKKVIELLVKEPDGVVSMSSKVAGLVETSLNLGIVEIKDNQLHTYYELRSSVHEDMILLKKKVMTIAKEIGANVTESASYPEWEYREKSALREKMELVYEKMYHKKPVVTIVHAGLECGVLAEKMEGFDGVSFGPNIMDIHTTKEKLDWESVERVWLYLIELLATKDETQEITR